MTAARDANFLVSMVDPRAPWLVCFCNGFQYPIIVTRPMRNFMLRCALRIMIGNGSHKVRAEARSLLEKIK